MTNTIAPQALNRASQSSSRSITSHCPGKSQIWKLTKEELETSIFDILVVLARKRVSFGDNFLNTTFSIDDLPLLKIETTEKLVKYNERYLHVWSCYFNEITEIKCKINKLYYLLALCFKINLEVCNLQVFLVQKSPMGAVSSVFKWSIGPPGVLLHKSNFISCCAGCQQL